MGSAWIALNVATRATAYPIIMSSTGGAPQADFAPSHAFTGVELSDSGGGGAVRHVVFDEAVIAEHDKDRGTRRKISEPKTPYRAPMSAGSVGSAASDDSMSGPVSADRLAAALGSGWDESDGDEGSCVSKAPGKGGDAFPQDSRSLHFSLPLFPITQASASGRAQKAAGAPAYASGGQAATDTRPSRVHPWVAAPRSRHCARGPRRAKSARASQTDQCPATTQTAGTRVIISAVAAVAGTRQVGAVARRRRYPAYRWGSQSLQRGAAVRSHLLRGDERTMRGKRV